MDNHQIHQFSPLPPPPTFQAIQYNKSTVSKRAFCSEESVTVIGIKPTSQEICDAESEVQLRISASREN